MTNKTQDAQARIDALAGRLEAMQARRRELMAQAVTLEARRDSPAAIAEAQATRQAIENLEDDIKTIEARDIPAARARLKAVEGERDSLAASIDETAKRIAPYTARLDVMERAAALLLAEIRKVGGDDTQDRRALALLSWIRGMVEDRNNLPAWRAKLERDY